MTHAKILVILVFQSGRENQRVREPASHEKKWSL